MQFGVSVGSSGAPFGFGFSESPQSRDILESVEAAASLGVRVLELHPDFELLHPGSWNRETLDGLADLKSSFDLQYTVHTPFHFLELCSGAEQTRQASVDCLLRTMEKTETLEPLGYVVHLRDVDTRIVLNNPRHPDDVLDRALDTVVAQARKSVGQLQGTVAGERLWLENLKSTNRAIPLFELAEELDTGMCLDAGHALLNGEDPVDYYRRGQGRIRHIHFHDVIEDHGSMVDHQPLGTGVMPIKAFWDELQATDYAFSLVLEIGNMEAKKQSLQYLQDNGFLTSWA